MRRLLYTLLIGICLSLLCWTESSVTSASWTPAGTEAAGVSLPKQCRTGKTSTEALGWRWRPTARVKVYYLKSSFSASEREALSVAVANWNKALREMDSRISFVVGGERESVAEDDASFTVLRGVPKGKERLGEIKFYSISNGVNYVTVTVSPVVTNPSALTSLMAHELGHSLGLADCYGCQRGTTTMAAFKENNKGNDVYEPSECDKAVVAAGYNNSFGAGEARSFQAGQR